MQLFRKMVISIIVLMLFFSYFFVPVQAKEEEKGNVNSKDEVIYATLAATGEQDEVFVVNLLNVTKAGIVKDYGDYTSVKNLTGLADMTQTDDKIETEAEKGKLYYQGNMKDVDLPWDISLSYRLDDEKIEPKSLIGKDGELEIKIDVKQNKAANKDFFKNYLLQIEIPFDADTTEKIKADDAVIANAGGEELVTFTSMPEEEGTFVVKADVEDFEMEGISISGVPSTMDIDAPDTDEMTDEIKTLSDAIQDVNDGVADLKQGIGELNQGSSELANGSEEYLKGINELDASSAELVNGSSEMNEALQTLNNELRKIDDIDLDVLKELQKGVASIADGFDEAQKGLKDLRENHRDAYEKLQKAVDNIPANEISEDEIDALYDSDADEETIDQLVATYEAAQEMKSVFSNVKASFDIVDETLGAIIDQLDKAANHVNQFNEEIGGPLDDFEIGDEFSELTSGINEMAIQYQKFHDGLVAYTGGVSELATNYTSLNDGMSELSNGMNELEGGTSELYLGTDKLARSTSDLPKEMTEEIDKMIDEFDKSDFDPVSFVSPDKNKDVFSVQFVMKTENLKQEKEETEEEPEEEKGFWEKFLDLFR